jgi:hypothetical protein
MHHHFHPIMLSRNNYVYTNNYRFMCCTFVWYRFILYTLSTYKKREALPILDFRVLVHVKKFWEN